MNGYDMFQITYVNMNVQLKQLLRVPKKANISPAMWKAWVESQGGQFNQIRKITYNPARHFIAFTVDDKTIADVLKANGK